MLKRITRYLVLPGIGFICWPFLIQAQFPPPAGMPGTTAIFKDSSVFINWAKTCTVSLGYINIVDTTIEDAGSNKANFGTPTDALGIADDHLISLGDGGSATLTFTPSITNGPGFDFAVFENALNDSFLELGFVEVSSDGNRFVRFPSTSLTPEDPQIGTFGSLDAKLINNLAGKYRVLYGTPFDLEELKDSLGLDISHVTHVRIIDVVGCMKPGYETYDAYRHKVNDPWPTNFYTGGFDLDAVGVIHERAQSVADDSTPRILISPNPCRDRLKIELPAGSKGVLLLADPSGKILIQKRVEGNIYIGVSELQTGIYFGRFLLDDGSVITRKIVRY